jgi:hypothetical protein
VVRAGIRFTSELRPSRKGELERLVFFNDNQHRVEPCLVEALRSFGAPSMVIEGDRVRFTVPRVPPVQTIFALDVLRRFPPLAAVAIFTREDDTLRVLFVAVREEYVSGGRRERRHVGAHLLELLSQIAARTKGVRWLRLTYHPRDLRIEVRRRAG